MVIILSGIQTLHETRGDSLQHRPIRLEELSDSLQAELIESAEQSEIESGEGSVEHVEVFRTVSVRTSILEDLDPYPATDPRTPATPSTAKSRQGALTRVTETSGSTMRVWQPTSWPEVSAYLNRSQPPEELQLAPTTPYHDETARDESRCPEPDRKQPDSVRAGPGKRTASATRGASTVRV